jgi:ATP-dependent Clp protease, protease subunit
LLPGYSTPQLNGCSFRDPEPSGGASGQASDIAIHAKEILRVRQLLTGIYQKHCGRNGETEASGLDRFGTSTPYTYGKRYDI